MASKGAGGIGASSMITVRNTKKGARSKKAIGCYTHKRSAAKRHAGK